MTSSALLGRAIFWWGRVFSQHRGAGPVYADISRDGQVFSALALSWTNLGGGQWAWIHGVSVGVCAGRNWGAVGKGESSAVCPLMSGRTPQIPEHRGPTETSMGRPSGSRVKAALLSPLRLPGVQPGTVSLWPRDKGRQGHSQPSPPMKFGSYSVRGFPFSGWSDEASGPLLGIMFPNA